MTKGIVREFAPIGDATLELATGEIARQADGAVVLTLGETVLLAAVTTAPDGGAAGFLPLTVEYQRRQAAAGKIPGGYNRREGRGTELDTLTSRLIDRSLRPLVRKGYRAETLVVVTPLSYDPATDLEVLTITAASAAMAVSSVPFDGPVVGVRVGRGPSGPLAFQERKAAAASGCDLVVSLTRDGVVMLEGGADEATEDELLAALDAARDAALPIIAAIERLRAQAGKPTRAVPKSEPEGAEKERLRLLAEPRIIEALGVAEKEARRAALAAIPAAVLRDLEGGAVAEKAEVEAFVDHLVHELMRREVLAGRRIGGRTPKEIREISGRTGYLKRCHGSALFTRGETQAVVTCTLGSEGDAQSFETLDGHEKSRFLLHYNFPPFSVGEARPSRGGPGRREVGHGYLARRALLPVLPPVEGAPFTIRLESLITESNGSSSMASVCGGTLAMLDAGLAVKRPVAGIAMGLVGEDGRYVVLSDIMGDEDHLGDMDFKVAGTSEGVTAIQLDNKLGALPRAVMAEALADAKQGRLSILARMAEIRSNVRSDMHPLAPRAARMKIEKGRIRDLIGPGGRNIKEIQEATGCSINVEQTGDVTIFSQDGANLEEAKARVRAMTGLPVLGGVYEGTVVACKDFGSFVRIFEGIEGLVAGLQQDEGTSITIEVTGVSDQGKLVLRQVRRGETGSEVLAEAAAGPEATEPV